MPLTFAGEAGVELELTPFPVPYAAQTTHDIVSYGNSHRLGGGWIQRIPKASALRDRWRLRNPAITGAQRTALIDYFALVEGPERAFLINPPLFDSLVAVRFETTELEIRQVFYDVYTFDVVVAAVAPDGELTEPPPPASGSYITLGLAGGGTGFFLLDGNLDLPLYDKDGAPIGQVLSAGNNIPVYDKDGVFLGNLPITIVEP